MSKDIVTNPFPDNEGRTALLLELLEALDLNIGKAVIAEAATDMVSDTPIKVVGILCKGKDPIHSYYYVETQDGRELCVKWETVQLLPEEEPVALTLTETEATMLGHILRSLVAPWTVHTVYDYVCSELGHEGGTGFLTKIGLITVSPEPSKPPLYSPDSTSLASLPDETHSPSSQALQNDEEHDAPCNKFIKTGREGVGFMCSLPIGHIGLCK